MSESELGKHGTKASIKIAETTCSPTPFASTFQRFGTDMHWETLTGIDVRAA